MMSKALSGTLVMLQVLSITFDRDTCLYAQPKDKTRTLSREKVDLTKSVVFGRTFVFGVEGKDSDRHPERGGWSDSTAIKIITPLPPGAQFYGEMIADNVTRTFKAIAQIKFTPSKNQIGEAPLFTFQFMDEHKLAWFYTIKVDILPEPVIDDFKAVAVGHTLRYVWNQTVPVLDRLDSLGWNDRMGITLLEPVLNNTEFYTGVFRDRSNRNNIFTGQIVFKPSKEQTRDESLFSFESTGQYGAREWFTLKVKVLEAPKIHQSTTAYLGEVLKLRVRRIIPNFEESEWPQDTNIRILESLPAGAKFYSSLEPDNSTKTIDVKAEIHFFPTKDQVNKEFLFTFEIISQRETYWHTIKVQVQSKDK